MALAVGFSSAGARSPALRRAPYLTDVVNTSATVNWATDRSAASGTLSWGPVGTDGQCTPSTTVTATRTSITVGAVSEYQWAMVLTFPAPGTYCYRVQLAGADLLGSDPSPRVTTAAAAASTGSFSFAVLGDWGAASTDEANVMSRIAASPAAFAVTTGDNVYNSGTQTEYGDLSTGTVFPQQYLPTLGNRPFYATAGNHGFSTNLPYLQNFPSPTATSTSGGRFLHETYCCISTLSGSKTYASAWYAFNWGSARFYMLEAAWADSQGGYQGDFLAHWNGPVAGCGPCGAERAWLEADLAAHASTPHKFAFFHYPLYADSSSQGSDTYLGGPNALEGLLAKNGVGIVFNGHAHFYERNTPQIPGSPLVSYVTGAGGATLGGVSGCHSFDAYAIGSGGTSCHAPKPASNANVFHFLLVTVNGSQVTVTPTDETGRTFDVQTYTFSGSGGGDTEAPTPPGALTATAQSSTRVDLSWTASTDNVGVTGYAVTRDGLALASTNGTGTTFADTAVQPGTTYTYTVRAFDAAGNLSGASNAASATTPSTGTTFTFTPTDDTYVHQATSTTNFGTATRLVTDNSPVDQALLRFDVATGGCRITRATLSLTVGSSSADGSNRGGDFHTTTSASWSESTVTWDTAPAANGATIASLGAVTVGTTYSVDLTAAVTGDGPLSLRMTTTSTDGARYFSKDGSTTQRPTLSITCA